ncbi:MAG: hypothetical protein ACRD8W_25145 [Nitrososphaeraceae archaeon]
MRILGYKVDKFGLYGIDAVIKCSELNIDDTISFIVDTGASITSISTVDILRLKGMDYDYSDLKPVEKGDGVVGIDGNIESVDTFYLPKTKLIFINEDTGKNILEYVNDGRVLRHKNINPDTRQLLESRMKIKLGDHFYTSLLGMDILKTYKISFSSLTATLE